MGKSKQIEIKNRTYYFYNNMVNFKKFDSSLLKIGKKDYKGINIYYIGPTSIEKTNDCENIYRCWDGIKNEIKTINSGEENN